MYKVAMLCALLCVNLPIYGSDSDESFSFECSTDEFLEALKKLNGGRVPEPQLEFVASCKTDDDAYLLVHLKTLHPHVKINRDLHTEFQEVHDIEGSVFQDKSGSILIKAWLEIATAVLRIQNEEHLVTEKKHLLLIGSNNKVEKGILSDREWSYEDLQTNNPAIPKKARLEILHAKQVSESPSTVIMAAYTK